VPVNGPGKIFGASSRSTASVPRARASSNPGTAHVSNLSASRRLIGRVVFILKPRISDATISKNSRPIIPDLERGIYSASRCLVSETRGINSALQIKAVRILTLSLVGTARLRRPRRVQRRNGHELRIGHGLFRPLLRGRATSTLLKNSVQMRASAACGE
jgi:hypothetical protein